MRDNMNYQEYDWGTPNDKNTGSIDSKDPWISANLPGTCIGEFCCSDGQTYDASLNQCIGDSLVESFVTESMVNKVLTKSSGKKSPDVMLNSTAGVLPNNSESFVNYQAHPYR